MKSILVLNVVLTFLPLMRISGQNTVIWAANDGVKVDKFDLNHQYKSGNYAWDGDSIKIFGAINEIVAFQVIVEAGIKQNNDQQGWIK